MLLAMPSILELCATLPKATFEPGAVLMEEGGTSRQLYVLIDGAVEILKGDFQVNIVAEPGAIFGEIAVLLDIPHMATVRALTPVNAYLVEAADAFLRSEKEIAYHLSKLLAQRLHGVTTYLVDLKHQFEDQQGHLGMVDTVLEALVHHQGDAFSPGSDRDPDIDSSRFDPGR
jgi:CRP-like cAMP-binding protein